MAVGSPIDVLRFFDRRDIPLGVKGRVRQAGVAADKSDKARGDAYRNMQAQIVIEVAKLNKQHRNPLGAAGGN
jgi:hypothetical protein